ncbi:MAG TPA: fructose-1,6-bisphosphatase, partial [Candidatus Altiarchaeales archaeon]|nr:fructose-1,6-bisphosphatase [Candidatus Altiarchaeales archaeon]
ASADYTVTLDPLDGSSNIKTNNLFGTIAGIYDSDKVPNAGKNQVAALYTLYGPMSTVMISIGDGVHEFAMNSKGQYVRITENVRFPEKPKVYGAGGDPRKWIPQFEKFVDWMVNDQGLKLRYGGSFVGDFNQILKHGGFFGYPALKEKPQGKLRLIVEGNPMSFIAEQAGGAGSTGTQKILDLQPENVDQRIPIYIGDKNLVEKLEEMLKQ